MTDYKKMMKIGEPYGPCVLCCTPGEDEDVKAVKIYDDYETCVANMNLCKKCRIKLLSVLANDLNE